MLNVFLNNKIPSTNDGWTDELISVATIYEEFDGSPYNRGEIESRFEAKSKRFPDSRDSSDLRDEYGAYATFFNLINYERDLLNNQWICHVNHRVKNLLCGIFPDPEAYMRLQLALFQYPNPIGIFYNENGTLNTVHNALSKRIELVNNGIQTSPFRLILGILIELSKQESPLSSYLTYTEIWACLFTQPEAVCTITPNVEKLARNVLEYRHRHGNEHRVDIPDTAVRNLHVLQHTGLINFESGKGRFQRRLKLVSGASDPETQIGKIARDISSLKSFFSTPPAGSKPEEIKEWTKLVIENGEWANYSDGDFLPSNKSATILESIVTIQDNLFNAPEIGIGAALLEFQNSQQEQKYRAFKRAARRANPEETNTLRERANLRHREIVKLIADRLRAIGERPLFNDYVDLGVISQAGKKLFEVKSCRPENLLAQVRKGVSQLYEYRYRHEDLHGAKPILVLETRPANELEWIIDYLIKDRDIAICWLEGEDTFAAPNACADSLGSIVHRLEA